jgi:predicted amino acid racemase
VAAPRLEIDLSKIAHNARQLRALYGVKGIHVSAVTKGVCGSPRVARVLLASGIRSLADSRIANIRKMRREGINAQFMLIRSPMVSEAETVVDLADISLNSEPSVIRRLADCASRRGLVHRIVLMVELGDLREGILPADLGPAVEQILGLDGVELAGLGTNLACFGGIKPTEAKMQELSAIAESIECAFGIRLALVSGGNSANYQWFVSTRNVGRVNHLRIGESILLGCDTLTRTPIPGLHTDAFTLVGEVIELRTKPSRPYGQVTQDAFGHTPIFGDKGPVRRAILALGRQDVDIAAIRPRADVDVVGASSDHLILEVRDPGLEVGKEVEFDVAYGTLLRAMMSPYVEKVYHPDLFAAIRGHRTLSQQRKKPQRVNVVPAGSSWRNTPC